MFNKTELLELLKAAAEAGAAAHEDDKDLVFTVDMSDDGDEIVFTGLSGEDKTLVKEKGKWILYTA